MDDHKKLAKGLFVNVLGMLSKTSRVIYLAVFSHMLGQDRFGLYMLAFSISEVISKFSVLGLESGMMRVTGNLLSKDMKGEARWMLNRVLLVCLVLSAVSMVISWLSAPWISEDLLRKPELTLPLQYFFLSIPGLCLTTTVLFSFRNTLDMKYENIIRSFIEPMMILGFGYVGLKLNLGVVGLAFAHATAAIVSLFISLFFFFRLFPISQKPKTTDWRTLIHTSLPMGGFTMLNMLKLKVDLFIIGRFLPLSSVGVYGAIIEINQIISKIRSLFDPILVPMIQVLHEKVELERMTQNLVLGIRWVMVPVLAIFGTVLLFPESYLSFFGEHYETGVFALCVYAFGQAVSSIFGMLENILAVTGHAYSVFSQVVLMIVTNFVLLLFFVPRFGLVGAALISTLYLVTISMWRLFYIKRKMEILPMNKSLLKPLFAFLISVGLFSIVTKSLPFSSLAFNVVLGISFFGTYVFLLVKMGLEPTDQEVAQTFLKKIR